MTHVHAVHRDRPAVERDEPADGVHERRLARTVRADQAHDLPLLESQIDAVDGPDALEVDADALRDELRRLRAVDSAFHAQLLRSTRYLTAGGLPEQGLPSPMVGTVFTLVVAICLSTPFVHSSTEYAAGCGRWHFAVNFILLPK